MIEAMRRAYQDRAEYVADPKFVSVPLEMLTSKQHGRDLASTIQTDRATPSAAAATGASNGAYESNDTTHFSVIDEAGNIVSNTYTINSFYGSQVMAKGT